MSSVKSFVSLKEKYDRVVVLIDMDCFYCQVEEYLDPKLANKPIAVVQYVENAGIIAVNYAARALGVTRHMREKEAKAICADLICVKVPSKNGKADISKYRDAGIQVAKVLQSFTSLLERASIDEAYLDISENVAKRMEQMRDGTFQLQASHFVNSFAVGYEKIGTFVQDVTSSVDRDFDDVPEEDRKAVSSSKLRLLVGAAIVNEIRKAVKDQTNYDCSAGIAHNKILAKLTAGMNKPNKQTILPIDSIPKLYNDLAINKVKSLGGKLGEEVCAKLNAKTMSDLLQFTEAELQHHFQPRVGSWLYLMARGIELETVTPKFMSKSIAVSKNYRGKNEISSVLTLKFWLKELAKEIVERLEKDAVDCNRTSKQLIVGFTQGTTASTRTVPLNGNALNSYTADQIADEAFEMIKKNSAKLLKAEGTVLMSQNIKHLAIIAGKFEDNNSAGTSKNLQQLFNNHKKTESKAEVPKAESSIANTSRCAALDMLKKFEMKSPKGMAKQSDEGSSNKPRTPSPVVKAKTPSPAAKHKLTTLNSFKSSSATLSCASEARSNEGPTQLVTLEFFDGEFSIKGLATLKHWIGVLVKKLCTVVQDDSSQHQRSPQVFIIKFKQSTGSKKLESSKSFPLSAFHDKTIDVDVILETLSQSENFRDKDGKIRNPIVQLELVAAEFESGRRWDFTIKDMKPVPMTLMNEVPLSSLNAVDNTGNSDEEADTCDSVKENNEDYDEELGDFLRNELEDIRIQESEKNDEAEMKIDSSPNYSPVYESNDFEDESLEVINDDEIIPNQPTNVAQKNPEVLTSTVADQPGTSTKTDQPTTSYLQTYAEFNPDPSVLELLNPKEPCTECGKMIAKLDMVSHLDHHLAFQIANEQRLEFRSQKKTSGSPVTPYQAVTKKATKNKTQARKPPVNLIEKYTVKKSDADVAPEAIEDKIKCDECQSFISVDQYVTHLDYHFAKKLRDEDLKVTVKVEPNRKRPGSTQKNQPKMKNLKTYFAAN